MDAYEVARRIRADGRHEDMLLIALTGWGQEKDRRRSRAAGIDHHLVKPPDIDKLRAFSPQHNRKSTTAKDLGPYVVGRRYPSVSNPDTLPCQMRKTRGFLRVPDAVRW